MQISQSLTRTTEDVLEKYKITKQPLIIEEILMLCDTRRSLKLSNIGVMNMQKNINESTTL